MDKNVFFFNKNYLKPTKKNHFFLNANNLLPPSIPLDSISIQFIRLLKRSCEHFLKTKMSCQLANRL